MSRNAEMALAFCWLLALAAAEEMTLNVNVKKPLAVVSDKFLSVTLDPVVLFNSEMLSDTEKSTNMAKALAPAYVRIAGPRSNSYIFERGLYPQEAHPDAGYTFSETHWINVHQWAEKSGLDVIASIAPQQWDSIASGAKSQGWDPRNALDLISFSDHMGYNTSWQLGYECQTRCDISGTELGRDVQRLRSMLDAFPRFAERGLVAGPDVVTFKTRQQQQYLQEYFAVASPSLSAVTWHPDFAGITLEVDGVSMHYDDLAVEKDNLYRVVGRHITKKPLWIAESRPEECKRQFLGALVWARRLGNSAKLGVQVLMRQPEDSNLFKATPDYWVSVLHKMLVGREVLDTKIAAGNRTHMHFFSHCTKPSSRYERGSLTIFGINLTPTKVIANIKGLKLKVVHKYMLLPGYDAPNRMFSESVLLNNDILELVDGKRVPDLKPIVSSTDKGVRLKLPSGGIGFWVLPGLKLKTCMGHEDEIVDKAILRKLGKRMDELDIEEDLELEEDSRDSETADPSDFIDERRSASPRSSQNQQSKLKRSPVRRSERYEREESDDKKGQRTDSVKHTKKSHHLVNLKGGGTRGIFENSDEEDDGSSEETVIKRPRSYRMDSGEVIRAKLHEYKKRLANYENKKKHREFIGHPVKGHSKTLVDPLTKKGMETEKVIEALTLITKVEGAVKGLEKANEPENKIRSKAPVTLSAGNFNDVTAGLKRSSGAPDTAGNDGLLDEVLNTEKSKRTSIPAKIEDQLRALYRLLSDEKDKREGIMPQRPRRDLDKRLGDDPLGLRRDSIFLRKRNKQEELRDRLIERMNERKQRLREKQGHMRREKVDRRETTESNENNFYGFQEREPLKNFPQGDMYFETGVESTEKADDKMIVRGDAAKKGEKKRRYQEKKVAAAVKKIQPIQDEHDGTWVEDGDGHLMPNEFYEKVKLQKFNPPRGNLKELGELGEAESVHKIEAGDKHTEQSTEHANYQVVTEKPMPESEDRRAKEKAVQQLMNYYETAAPQEKNYDFADLRQNGEAQQQMQQQMPYQQVPPTYQQDPRYVDPSRYYDPNAYLQQPPPYPRLKRNVNDIEAVLHREMVNQDDNNLKDCQCRVIRGIEECKDCIVKGEKRYRGPLMPPGYEAPNPLISNYARGFRYRRDVEVQIKDNNETNSNNSNSDKDSIGTDQEVETATSYKDQSEDLTKIPDGEKIQENVNPVPEEIEETVTEALETQMKLEDDYGKSAANRLPRKIESPSKIFFRSVPASKKSTKENLKATRKQTRTVTTEIPSVPSTSNAPVNSSVVIDSFAGNEPKTDDKHITNIRSADVSINEAPSSAIASADKAAVKVRKTIVKTQPFRAETITATPITPSSTTINAVYEKRSADDSDSEKKIIGDAKNTGNQESVDEKGNIEEKIVDTSTVTSILNDSDNSKVTLADSKNKSKPASAKTRQSRLTTRAEALAALRKENESRRAKKMIETSMKIIESENARFAEYQKRRHEQLERLKVKLRAKREKMLQQYREELLEAINESPDPTGRNLHRRQLLEKYDKAEDESRKNTMITDPEKLAYIMRYRPIKYSVPKEDSSKSEEEAGYVPVVEVLRAYEPNRRLPSSRKHSKTSIYRENESGEYEPSKDRKRSIPLDKQTREDDIFSSSIEQESQSTNVKRSPYCLMDREATIDQPHSETPSPMESDSSEYYGEAQGSKRSIQLLEQYKIPPYYPRVAYPGEDLIPINIEYDPQQQSNINMYHVSPSYEHLVNNYYGVSQEQQSVDPNLNYNTNLAEQQAEKERFATNYYSVNEETTQQQHANQYQATMQEEQPEENYHNSNQEAVFQQEPKMNNYEINSPESKEATQNPIEQNYQKLKGSNLKILEIDPSMYDEDDSNYNLDELFAKPSSSYLYGQDPDASRRYRREADITNAEDNGPLFFSLGLEESKMHEKRNNVATSDGLIRRKRVADDTMQDKIEKSQARSPINKNIKKAYGTDYDNKYRKSTNIAKYTRPAVQYPNTPVSLDNEETYQYSSNFQTFIPTRIHNLDVDNHLPENENAGFRSKRQKRSANEMHKQTYKFIDDNSINRLNDPEMDEIWSNLIEMEQDEQLLKEYDRKKGWIMHNFDGATQSSNVNEKVTTVKAAESTTQANIESMLVDAIPKLENVITGGLKKAQNLTSSLEDFIENFDDQSSDAAEISSSGNAETTDDNDGRLSHNIFEHMVGGVKKFFGLVSNIANNIFRRH